MVASDTMLSIRLPHKTREALDEAARLTKRSRAYLLKEALERHLHSIVREEQMGSRQSAYTRLYQLQGAGVEGHGRSASDIDQTIQGLRRDD